MTYLPIDAELKLVPDSDFAKKAIEAGIMTNRVTKKIIVKSTEAKPGKGGGKTTKKEFWKKKRP